MIVRESPSPRKPTTDTQWPPRSPQAALVASPSGRKRLEKYYQHRRNVSPTSRKRTPSPMTDAQAAGSDDDEETLQLQLKAIEAKLKLKKLQKKKDASVQPVTQPVQVPSSPRRQRAEQPAVQSPKRAQLGIDKGLTAADVSLRHPRKNGGNVPGARTSGPSRDVPKPKSFTERLMATRTEDREKEHKQRQTIAGRSQTFGTRMASDSSQKENVDAPRRSAQEKPTKVTSNQRPDSTLSRSREQPRTSHRASPPRQPASESQDLTEDHDPHSGFALTRRNMSQEIVSAAVEDKEAYPLPRLLKEVHAPQYDPPDAVDYVVYGVIASKSKPFNHAPNNLTSSSDPDAQPQRSKFMVMRLTDLEWEIDLYLFGPGFETFWKLTTGTVVAILNPGIMPPKPHQRDTGKFSLKLASSEDTVLEIGVAKDLGFCKSVKSDGQVCGQWVDGRKTEFCEFHVGLQVARNKSSRMEINTMGNLGLFSKPGDRGRGGARGRGGSRGGRGSNSYSGGGRGRGKKEDTRLQGQYYDREARETAFTVPSILQRGMNATKLLDADDYGPGAGLSATERSQKRRAAREKERDLARALGDSGSGVGVEYLRSTHDPEQRQYGSSQQRRDEELKDASSFGLVRSSAATVNLDPVNGRKNRHEKAAVGWSKAFKRGLSPSAPICSPSPKKARFMLDGKGMRTPGAVSEGRPSGEVKRRRVDEDDDDDLELV